MTEYIIKGETLTALADAIRGKEEVKNTIPNYISNRAYLTQFPIPEGTTKIRPYAFRSCVGLTEVVLPEGLTEIGDNAFYGCTNLVITNIPASVTKIGANAFYGCKGLTEITFDGVPTSIASNAFTNCTNLANIIFPSGTTPPSGGPWGAPNASFSSGGTIVT